MLANHVFWWLMLFYTHLLLLLQPSLLWLSIVTFNNDTKPPPKWILRAFDVSRIRPRVGWLPHLETFTWQIWPRLRGLPGLADRATALAGHLTYHVNVIKLKWNMDRRVTPPTWGPLPPCKQAPKHSKLNGLKPAMSWSYQITYKHKIKCGRANGLNSSYRPEKDTTSLHVS